MNVFWQGRENGAEIEQLVLDAPQNDEEQPDTRVAGDHLFTGDDGQAQKRIYFVHGAICFDASGILGDTLAPGQAGFAGIAALGVNAVESETRIVKRLVIS
jgi:hypothetical protein